MKLHFVYGDDAWPAWSACGLLSPDWYTRDIAQFRAEEHRCKQCARRKVVRDALS